MDQRPTKVLFVEDDLDFALVMEQALTSAKGQSFEVQRADTLSTGIKRLASGGVDVVLLDLNLKDCRGLETLARVNACSPHVPIVVLTGSYDDEKLAIEALKQGAEDYLVKGHLDHGLLIRSLRYAIERKQKEKEIRRAEAQTEELLRSIPSILIGINANDAITHWNHAAEATFGIASAQVLNRPFSACGIQWDMELVLSCIAKCRQTNQPVRLDDLSVKRSDGTDGFLGITVNPVRPDSEERAGILLLGADVTERKRAQEERRRLEEQLQQVQKMESLGTLAGGIAHDFKNILGPILGYTEMTKRSLPAGSKDRERLDKVLQCVRRAHDLVNQIVQFSRKGEERRRAVDLVEIVGEVLTMLKAVIPSTIELSLQLDRNAGVIFADPTQLHQVLMNMCSNASYAMREKGGRLTVAVQAVRVEENVAPLVKHLRPGPYVKLTVSDTGVGIDPKVLPRIYEPFFTTKPVGEGSGMGLAAVYGIVTRHGGAITVSSELGKGTTFDVYLPKISETIRSEPAEESQPPRGTERILLVDDRLEVLDMAGDLLESLGYQVDRKLRSLEALEFFRSGPTRVDLVITDQTMPKLTGTGLIGEMRKIRPDLPVILMTGNTDSSSPELCKELNVQEYLEKPIALSDLAHAVRRALKSVVAVKSARPGDPIPKST